MHRRALAAAVLTISLLATASAQAQSGSGPEPPNRLYSYLGGGLLIGINDATHRVTTPEHAWSPLFMAEAGTRNEWLGLALEFRKPFTASGIPARDDEYDRQNEHLFVGAVKTRVLRVHSAAVDAMFGAGALFQRRSTAVIVCGARCSQIVDKTDKTTVAFSAGADVPIRMTSKSDLTPLARIDFVNRIDVDAPRNRAVTLSIGVTLRAVW